MVMLITFGNYVKKYKYIIFYILTRLPYEYFLGNLFPDDMKINYLRSDNFPNEIIIYDIFKYLSLFLFSFLLLKLESKNVSSINLDAKTGIKRNSTLTLIYNADQELPTFSLLPIILYMILFLIIHKLSIFYSIFGFSGLDFWMLQIIFMCIINIILFKVKVYSHQKVAVSIILIFSTLMKILSIICIFNNESMNNIYKKYHWLIPIGIISLLILLFIESFIFYKTKWYLDLKFISEKNVIKNLGMLGFIMSLIISLITNFIKCGNNIFYENVCLVENNNEYYFDNFKTFFLKIWMGDRAFYINIIFIFILLIKLFVTFLYAYFSILIIKYLSPEYLICSDSILYSIVKITVFIYYVCTNKIVNIIIFDTLSQLFSLLGTVIYLELIQLNFCGLNFNLRKNIYNRAILETLSISKSKDNINEYENDIYE